MAEHKRKNLHSDDSDAAVKDPSLKGQNDTSVFKRTFIDEANRQWDHKQKIDNINKKVEYIQGSNSNAVGRFLKGAFLKPGDNKLIETSRVKLLECGQSVDQMILTLKNEDENLYVTDGRRLKSSGFAVQHSFNQSSLEKLDILKHTICTLSEKLQQISGKCQTLFGQKRKSGRTELGQEKKQKHHNKRKAFKRRSQRIIARIKCLVHKLFPLNECEVEHIISEGRISPRDFRVSFHDDISMFNLEFNSIFMLGIQDVNSLFSLIESGVIPNSVKCLILDNLNSTVEERYWHLFEKEYAGQEQTDTSGSSDSESDS